MAVLVEHHHIYDHAWVRKGEVRIGRGRKHGFLVICHIPGRVMVPVLVRVLARVLVRQSVAAMANVTHLRTR